MYFNIPPIHLCLLLCFLFPSCFGPNILLTFNNSPMNAPCPTHIFILDISTVKYFMNSKSYGTPRKIFTILLSLSLAYINSPMNATCPTNIFILDLSTVKYFMNSKTYGTAHKIFTILLSLSFVYPYILISTMSISSSL
jgi:hypothetical protein